MRKVKCLFQHYDAGKVYQIIRTLQPDDNGVMHTVIDGKMCAFKVPGPLDRPLVIKDRILYHSNSPTPIQLDGTVPIISPQMMQQMVDTSMLSAMTALCSPRRSWIRRAVNGIAELFESWKYRREAKQTAKESTQYDFVTDVHSWLDDNAASVKMDLGNGPEDVYVVSAKIVELAKEEITPGSTSRSESGPLIIDEAYTWQNQSSCFPKLSAWVAQCRKQRMNIFIRSKQ